MNYDDVGINYTLLNSIYKEGIELFTYRKHLLDMPRYGEVVMTVLYNSKCAAASRVKPSKANWAF